MYLLTNNDLTSTEIEFNFSESSIFHVSSSDKKLAPWTRQTNFSTRINLHEHDMKKN